MPSAKWEQHILCVRLIREHRDWTNERVLEEAGMRPQEENIVAEARREVENEVTPGVVSWQRSY